MPYYLKEEKIDVIFIYEK